jgi:hypothetical protein
MIAAATFGGRRLGLDALVAQMTDPGFAVRYCRAPSMAERGGHVSPSMLVVQSPRSRYVRSWRRHARRCTDCARVFRFMGLSLR